MLRHNASTPAHPPIRFVGPWTDAARQSVARAVADAEALYARGPTQAPWICYCARLKQGGGLYAAHPPGRAEVLYATGPGALGTQILLCGFPAAALRHTAPWPPDP